MHAQIAVPKKFNLYIPDLDNHIRIENGADGVIISATRDNFSDNRKMFFIRHLSAEGFIPDRHKWFHESVADGFFGVKWIVRPASSRHQAGLHGLRKLWTRRNALYGSLFLVWLFLFVLAVRLHSRVLGL